MSPGTEGGPGMNRNPEVDRWFEQAGHPLEGDGRLVRTMRCSDLGDLEAGKADLEAAVRAWCDGKATPAASR